MGLQRKPSGVRIVAVSAVRGPVARFRPDTASMFPSGCVSESQAYVRRVRPEGLTERVGACVLGGHANGPPTNTIKLLRHVEVD